MNDALPPKTTSTTRATSKPATWKLHEARIVLLVSIALTAVLYAVPHGDVLAWPFLLISTVAHEMGHGMTALLAGGSFQRFEMWPDGSGVATWSGEAGRLQRAVVAAGGLVGPAIAAAIGFAAGRTRRGAVVLLRLVAAFLVLALVLVVRGFFGFVFVAVLVAVCAAVAFKATADLARLVLVFLSVQLALSVFSRADYLFMASAQTGGGIMPSDVGQIAAALFLPYWFWGGVCGALSLLALGYGVRTYWR